MSLTMLLQFLLPALLALVLGVPAAFEQAWLLVFLVAVGTLIWAALLAAKKGYFNSVFFILFSIFIIWAYFEGVPLIALIAAICLNLAAWNTANFRSALAQVDRADNLHQMESARLKRLGLTLAAAFFLTLIPTLVQIKFSFLLIAILITLTVVLLGRALAALHTDQNKQDKTDMQ